MHVFNQTGFLFPPIVVASKRTGDPLDPASSKHHHGTRGFPGWWRDPRGHTQASDDDDFIPFYDVRAYPGKEVRVI